MAPGLGALCGGNVDREAAAALRTLQRGGFRLARAAGDITLLDVVTAIEGPDDPFECREIRQRGAMEDVPKADFRDQCVIAAAMRRADIAWRRELAAQTLADIRTTIDRDAPLAQQRMRDWHERRAGSVVTRARRPS